MMIGTRRLVASSSRRLASHAPPQQRRVFLSHAKPPPGAPQHVRNYQSTFKEAYFMANTATLPMEVVEVRQSLWQQFVAWYSEKLTTHPLLTKSLTGALIAAAGDVLCQAGTYTPEADEQRDEYGNVVVQSNKSKSFWTDGWDVRRSFHFFVLGLTFVAPTSHYWYGGMAVHPWTRGQCFGQISKRVVLDQFVWTPIFFVIWLSGFWTMEANGNITGAQVKTQLTEHLPDVMIANWMLWIPAQYLNFYACPVKFQVLFTNVVELAWNAYLSFATGGGGGGHDGGNNKKEEVAVEKEPEIR